MWNFEIIWLMSGLVCKFEDPLDLRVKWAPWSAVYIRRWYIFREDEKHFLMHCTPYISEPYNSTIDFEKKGIGHKIFKHKRKGKISDSVLWQKPLHPQKKSKKQRDKITQWLLTDLNNDKFTYSVKICKIHFKALYRRKIFKLILVCFNVKYERTDALSLWYPQ